MTDKQRVDDSRLDTAPTGTIADLNQETGSVYCRTTRACLTDAPWRYGVYALLAAGSLAFGCRPQQKRSPGPLPAKTETPVAAEVESAEVESAPAWSEPMPPLPSSMDAATNMSARMRLMMRDNARAMAEKTQRKTQLVNQAREQDPELRKLYEEAVAARQRYEERLGQSDDIKQIDNEIEQMQRMQGRLLAQRQRFEKENEK